MCIRQKTISASDLQFAKGAKRSFLYFVIFFYLGLVQTNEAKPRWGARELGVWAFLEGPAYNGLG